MGMPVIDHHVWGHVHAWQQLYAHNMIKKKQDQFN